MVPEEQKQAEAASWKRWQGEWGNTESGAHAYGWKEGYKAGQAEVERLRDRAHIARELLQEIVDALEALRRSSATT